MTAAVMAGVSPSMPGEISPERVAALLETLTTTGSPDEFQFLSATEVIAGEVGTETAQSGPLIHLDTFRAAPEFAGIDGSGFAVVVVDTGIDLNHPFFGPDVDGNGVSDRIVFSYDFSGANDPDASDFNDHGSNVTSIAASSDPATPGMAPGASIIHLKVFPNGAGGASTSDIEEALQWVVANAATYNVASVNLSLGSDNVGFHDNELDLSDEYAALAALDIFTTVAAGNSFFDVLSQQGVNGLAADPNVISVGAVYDANIGGVSYGGGAVANSTGPDRITPFSQRDEFLLDVMAPGAAIRGANRNGGTVTMHGTSQAAPHIAGIAVLAQDLAVQTLGRRLHLDEFKTLLKQSGVTINDGDDENDNVVNTGLDFARVDVLALANAILALEPASIAGTVFDDHNGNGIDDNEPGLAGWTVYLDDNGNGSLDTGSASFGSTDVPKAIADLDTLNSNLNILGLPGRITDVNVQLSLTHTFDGDLQAYLISPQGTRIELFTDVGAGGDNFSGTMFNDEAATNITVGGAPFSGSFRPEESLSRLDGEDPNGEWRLEISDDAGQDVGTLDGWSLTLSYAEWSQQTAESGDYLFFGLPAGDYQVRQIPESPYAQTAPLVPNYHAISVAPGEAVVDRDFGNRSDIVLHAVSTNGGNQITVTYELVGLSGTPFEIGVYRSADTIVNAGDTAVDTVLINAPQDLTSGLHTRALTIGTGVGELALPGFGAVEPNLDYRLLLAADPLDSVAESDADATAEDNTRSLLGAYHATGGPLMVFGSDAPETLAATASGANLDLSVAGRNYSYASNDVTTVRIRGLGGNDALSAAGVPKSLFLWGGAGNDVLTGGSADDALDGGLGNDSYVFDADVPLGSDAVSDPAGIDTLNFGATANVGISVDLSQSALQNVHPNLALQLNTGISIESVVGTQQADSLFGNAGANSLDGVAGNDRIEGRSGRDTVTGGAGNDTLVGGTGDDSYAFDVDLPVGIDTIDESSGGIDTVSFLATTSQSISLDLSLAAPQVVHPNLTLQLGSGSTLENAVGGSQADSLFGNALANRFTGGPGNDTLAGRGGDDTYLFDTDSPLGTDTLVENSGEGRDALMFHTTTSVSIAIDMGLASQTVNANLDLVLSLPAAFENVWGTALADSITGNSAGNRLEGVAGDDTLLGGDGPDTLSGGAGDDASNGGPGNDVYEFATNDPLGSDTLDDPSGTDLLSFSKSTLFGTNLDLSQSAVQNVNPNLSLTLGAENRFESATGGPQADILLGNSLNNVLTGLGGADMLSGRDGSDLLIGGSGDDTLRGGAGNDTFKFDAHSPLGADTVDESEGGFDTLNLGGTTSDVAVDLSNPAAQAVNGSLTLTLGASDVMEGVIGGFGNDTLVGNGLANSLAGGPGDDSLTGGVANDTLVGGGGNDTLAGEAGDDEYRFKAHLSAGSDMLFENPSDDRDWLSFAETTGIGVSVDLASIAAQVISPQLTIQLNSATTFENVLGTNQADSILGNAASNVLVGLGGDDQLSGLGARDLLFGGLGSDTLLGGNADDLLVGGRTTHELNRGALDAIAGEWLSAGSYATRTTNLRAALLDAGTTVLDDGAIDSITGEGDRDWFFGQPTEVLDRAVDEDLDN